MALRRSVVGSDYCRGRGCRIKKKDNTPVLMLTMQPDLLIMLTTRVLLPLRTQKKTKNGKIVVLRAVATLARVRLTLVGSRVYRSLNPVPAGGFQPIGPPRRVRGISQRGTRLVELCPLIVARRWLESPSILQVANDGHLPLGCRRYLRARRISLSWRVRLHPAVRAGYPLHSSLGARACSIRISAPWSPSPIH